MQSKTTKLFSSELNKNLYPISADEYFNKTKIGAYSLSAMRSIVKDNKMYTNEKKTLNILDWGCGNSLWAFALFPRANITGVDLSSRELKYSAINAKQNNSKFKGILFDRDIPKLKNNLYDHSIAIALIELMDEEVFYSVFQKIFDSLKPGAKLFVTHHNYRLFSAVYLPWILRGGYSALKKRMRMDIQKKSTENVISDFSKIGYLHKDSGAFNPYPTKLWPYIFSRKGFLIRTSLIKNWYYSQFIVLQKPYSCSISNKGKNK